MTSKVKAESTRKKKSAPSHKEQETPIEVELVTDPDTDDTSDDLYTDNEEADDIELIDDSLNLDLSDTAFDLDEADLNGSDDIRSINEKTDALIPFTHRPPRRASDSLHFYIQEISKFPLLEPEEELVLSRKVKETGDPDAAFRLITSHLRLVVRIAMDFQRRWMQNVLDLVQEGNVGLVRAVSKFDPEKGIKFSYYATFWIKAYILKFIMDNWRLVKIGTTQTQRKLFYNLNKERQLLIAQGFDPDVNMLAERLNVTPDQITEMEQRLDASDLSLNAPMNNEDTEGASKMDYLPALGPGVEEVLANAEISHMVRERLESLIPLLSDKESYILHNRLLAEEPVTLREIGEKFSITRERVRQIEARLLQKVRDHLFTHINDFSRNWIE